MQTYELLEEALIKWSGVDYVAVCSSGTAALHLAFEALELPKGSEVIMPDLTMVACARAAVMAGLTPVFVDCDHNLNLDIAKLDDAYSSRTRAVLLVHTYGRICRTSEVADFCDKRDLYLVEDLAEAHGIPPHPSTDIACWSFYRNKIVAGEEGGALASKWPEVINRAKQLRSLGFTADHDYNHTPRGHNYRLANVLAELVLHNLRTYSTNVRKRWNSIKQYTAACPSEWRMPRRDAPWVFDFRVRGMTTHQQNKAVKALKAEGIEARHCFKPMHTQEEFCTNMYYGRNCERAAREVIYLPLLPTPRTDAFAVVANALA